MIVMVVMLLMLLLAAVVTVAVAVVVSAVPALKMFKYCFKARGLQAQYPVESQYLPSMQRLSNPYNPRRFS